MTASIKRPDSFIASTPRLAADGMDSEVLRQQDLINAFQHMDKGKSSQSTHSGRHRNLNTSPSSTSISKVSSTQYIPHEPVKGAVKAVPKSPPASSAYRSSPTKWGLNKEKTNSHHGLFQDLKIKSSSSILDSSTDKNQSHIDSENLIKPQMTVSEAVNDVSGSMISSNKELVRSIHVPFYNAPSHLDVKTYETIRNYEKQKRVQDPSVPSLNDNHIILNMSPAANVDQTTPELPKEIAINLEDDVSTRSVEGQVELNPEGYNLNKEIKALRDKLDIQTKINADLKKMLVASMGDDLHHRVECLVRTNAQMASEMGLYSNKITQDGENIDQLGIQADVWRSKYHASRLQVEELLSLKAALLRQSEETRIAVRDLLQERYHLRDSLYSTYRLLQQLSDAFEPLPPTNRAPGYGPKTVTDIATKNYKLADNIKFRLLGAIQLYPALYSSTTPDILTPAEQEATQILMQKPVVFGSECVNLPPRKLSQTTQGIFNRFNPHPYTKHDNITFNCCAKCKGDIHVV